ncbi:MAG: chromosome segregation protein [Crocinitomicaceae bacterium]|jgi:chromosome segregation protein
MYLKRLELNGFKSFAHKSEFVFDVPIIAIVGPNGSGKSNVVESIRFVLGEQSVKSMRGKTGSDMIFKGSKEIPKMSRASVSIVFDNIDRVFHIGQHNNTQINVDFDEVMITREVYIDGANKYLINGQEVRMRDIHELIASVNIGASGHHIISQGEADRYLNSNIKDRRELIEEALGLKVYQYRIKESERKLTRAHDNMRESELLRRELAPHLRFLKRQVEKIEKAKNLRSDLGIKYQSYLGQEDYLIKKLGDLLDTDRNELQLQYDEFTLFMESAIHPDEQKIYKETALIQNFQRELQNLAQKTVVLRQEIGRAEGMISLLEKQQQAPEITSQTPPHPGFSFQVIKDFLSNVLDKIETVSSPNSTDINNLFATLRNDIQEFIKQPQKDIPTRIDNSQEISRLSDQRKTLEKQILELSHQETILREQISELESKRIEKQESERESQKQYYEFVAKKRELDAKRSLISARDESLGSRQQARHEEYQEALVLLGVPGIEYQSIAIEHDLDVTAQTQETERREMERLKIRLEDMGGASGIELIQEYEETMDRDGFLEKEIDDINQSILSLEKIIDDLKETLNGQFDIGIKKINEQFDRFFKLMFGGGQAKLEPAIIKKRRKKLTEGEQMELVPEEEDQQKAEYGIDIHVKLPRKKVSDLDMLSGGERSLTSIALLFALSQVNPPPFLVLDETDAALDEANSQRYGDMVEQLSKFSQLIVVTHNRETMSRAQTLFGVTLGRGDASATLSLRLEDATAYAK